MIPCGGIFPSYVDMARFYHPRVDLVGFTSGINEGAEVVGGTETRFMTFGFQKLFLANGEKKIELASEEYGKAPFN